MGDHRCENCGKMFYTRYVQSTGNCFCQECSAKLGVAKKEKEYRKAKEYWESKEKVSAGLLIASIDTNGKNKESCD
jgi:uncharacterized Zn finger protein (UPF0148 family)